MTAQEKDEVYRLRYQVFVEEEQRFEHASDRIFDIYDTLNETINVIAMEHGTVVGSLRATIENPVGIPALEHYDFQPLMANTAGKFASIGWLCIAERYRRHRGILPGLFKMIVREAKQSGVQHLIAPLHPPILPLLKRFGARAIDEEFVSGELKVPMVPIHIDFKNLPPGLREFSQDPFSLLFAEENERRIYRQGESIVKKGEAGNEAFLIMRGAVEVLVHSESRQADLPVKEGNEDGMNGNPLLGPGQVFGELAMLDNRPRTATVIGHSKEVDVMVWDKEQLFQQLQSDNHKAIQLCQLLANRFRMEMEGYQKDQSREALVATILLDASREGKELVALRWLASQCGIRVKNMQVLIKDWVGDNMVRCDDGRTIEVLDINPLREKVIWI
jgi:CRP-like cAMP-binding protein